MGLSPTSGQVDAAMEEINARFVEYQDRLLELSTRMHEQEREHRETLALKDARIAELEAAQIFKTPAMSSSGSPEIGAVCPPVESKPKIKILEQRIIEMTILLDEKDKAVYEAEDRLDQVKIETNQMRVEVTRIPDLLVTINELEHTVSELRAFEVRKNDEVERLLSTILDLEHSRELLRHEIEEVILDHDKTLDKLTLTEQLLATHQIRSWTFKLEKLTDTTVIEPVEEVIDCPIPKETVEMLTQTGCSLIILSPKMKTTSHEDGEQQPAEIVQRSFSGITKSPEPKLTMQLKDSDGQPLTTVEQVQSVLDEQNEKIRNLQDLVESLRFASAAAPSKPQKLSSGGCLPSFFSRKSK